MVVFGFAEIVTGFRHNFFALHTAQGVASAGVGSTIGALYALAGLFLLTMKRRMAIFAILLLIVVIAGRIFMVATNLYPIETFRQAAGISLGTAIAAGFTVYIWIRRSAF
jgi:hypothetical protein